jgi:ligand-binding SRPBCC domain-containing protein
VARHDGYIAGRRFCDEQVRGPFVAWRHVHLFEPIGASHTLYQDRIEFAVSRSGALNRVAAAVLRPALTLAFRSRHRTVRAGICNAARDLHTRQNARGDRVRAAADAGPIAAKP